MKNDFDDNVDGSGEGGFGHMKFSTQGWP